MAPRFTLQPLPGTLLLWGRLLPWGGHCRTQSRLGRAPNNLEGLGVCFLLGCGIEVELRSRGTKRACLDLTAVRFFSLSVNSISPPQGIDVFDHRLPARRPPRDGRPVDTLNASSRLITSAKTRIPSTLLGMQTLSTLAVRTATVPTAKTQHHHCGGCEPLRVSCPLDCLIHGTWNPASPPELALHAQVGASEAQK